MRIGLTGSTGLVGNRLLERVNGAHEILPFKNVDITDKKQVDEFLDNKQPEIIFHLAAKTNVDGCEEDKRIDLKMMQEEGSLENGVFHPERIQDEGWRGKKTAFAINAVGTRHLSDWARIHKTKIFYVSTDFVFSGNEEYYTEESAVNPVNWYGMTKYYGEVVVSKAFDAAIFRLAFPYGYPSVIKKDVVWGLFELFKTRDEVQLISNQVITPTFIDDFIDASLALMEKNVSGLYHVVGSSFITPVAIGKLIRDTFGFKTKIGETTVEKLYEGRAKRPFQARMKNDRIKSLGIQMKTFEEGLKLIAQMTEFKS